MWAFLTACWLIAYNSSNAPHEYKGRALAGVHAIASTLLSVYYLLYGGSIETLSSLTSSYVVYDTIVVILYGFKWEMLAHHAVLGYAANYILPVFPYHTCVAYLCEITNVFLHLSWYMYVEHIKDWRFQLSAALTVVTFFAFRLVTFTYLMYAFFKVLDVPGYACLSILTSLNYYWFVQIVQMYNRVTAHVE